MKACLAFSLQLYNILLKHLFVIIIIIINKYNENNNNNNNNNKCIGDDTKAAACQSPNCIKKQKKIKYGEKRFSIMVDGIITPCNMARS